jgi:hypothetical protein
VTNANATMQVLLDQVASGQLSRRQFKSVAVAAGLYAGPSGAIAIVAGELSKTGATVLVTK